MVYLHLLLSEGDIMRIGIIGIMHESNTFIGTPTHIEDFKKDVFAIGNQIRESMDIAPHEVGGFFEVLDEAKVEVRPILFARALPGGTISAEAFDRLIEIMLEELEKAGSLDGVLTAPHGANVSENHPDMDGYWLSLLRERLGKNIPIISTLDPHANLSPQMAEAVNAIVAYRTNPHLDQRQRGCDAARLLIRTIKGEICPVMRAAFPSVAINIERQAPHAYPCRTLYDLADQMLSHPAVLSNSILLGFPYSDVEKMGSSFVTITDNNPELAQQFSNELASSLWTHREEFVGQFVSARDAIKDALNGEGPVCLLDMGDNVGGGAPGDGTLLGYEFERFVQNTGAKNYRAFLSLYDPEAAAQSFTAGPGQRLRLRMGGKQHPLYEPPLEADVSVVSLHEGKFLETEVRHYGMTCFDMGPTAIVQTDSGLVIQLTSQRVYPTSIKQLTSCGIDPRQFNLLVAKGVHAPVAAYEPFSKRIIRVNTPGVTCADMRQLSYKNRRRPLFPFENPR